MSAPMVLPAATVQFRCRNPGCSYHGDTYEVVSKVCKVVLGQGTLEVKLQRPEDGQCPACGCTASYVSTYYQGKRLR